MTDDNNIDNMFTQNEINRMMFNNQQQQFSQQQRMSHNNADMSHVHPTNMSKFFDFHKQQQQQNQFMINSNNPMTDQLNMANLLDNHHRMNPNNFMDQTNGKLIDFLPIDNSIDSLNDWLMIMNANKFPF